MKPLTGKMKDLLWAIVVFLMIVLGAYVVHKKDDSTLFTVYCASAIIMITLASLFLVYLHSRKQRLQVPGNVCLPPLPPPNEWLGEAEEVGDAPVTKIFVNIQLTSRENYPNQLVNELVFDIAEEAARNLKQELALLSTHRPNSTP